TAEPGDLPAGGALGFGAFVVLTPRAEPAGSPEQPEGAAQGEIDHVEPAHALLAGSPILGAHTVEEDEVARPEAQRRSDRRGELRAALEHHAQTRGFDVPVGLRIGRQGAGDGSQRARGPGGLPKTRVDQRERSTTMSRWTRGVTPAGEVGPTPAVRQDAELTGRRRRGGLVQRADVGERFPATVAVAGQRGANDRPCGGEGHDASTLRATRRRSTDGSARALRSTGLPPSISFIAARTSRGRLIP